MIYETILPLPHKHHDWWGPILQQIHITVPLVTVIFYGVGRKCRQLSMVKIKIKCTLVQALSLCTGRMAHRGSRGVALLFLDHGIRRGWGVKVTPRPVFTPGKDPVPIAQEAVWAPGPFGQVREISPPPEFDPRTVQHIASCYTDCATRRTNYLWLLTLFRCWKRVKRYIIYKGNHIFERLY